MQKKRMKHLCLLLAVLLLSTSLAACGGTAAPSSGASKAGSAAAASGTESSGSGRTDLIIAAGGEPATLHPIDQNFMMTAVMCYQMYNTLFKLDDKMNAVPDLVESYERSSDTEYVLKLRQGVKFHNGNEMTAEDVKASLEYSASVPKAAQFVETIASIEVVDPYTIKITTNGPSSKLLFDLTNPQTSILSKELIDGGHDFNANPIGTGPFKFVSYTQGDKIELERFADFFDKENLAGMEKITWRFIPEGAARTIALESGDVDMIYDVDPIDISSLQQNPEVEVFTADSAQLHSLNFNLGAAPFDNADFRKAIGAAIDRQSLAQVAASGLAEVVTTNAPMGMFGSSDEGGIAYDIEKAKEYLEKSGVDAASVTLPILASNDTRKKQAEVIQANLAELGIKVEIVTVDSAAYFAALDAKDYVGSLGSYAQRTLPAYINFINSSNSDFAKNRVFSDAKVDELLTKINSTLDDTEREKLIQECIVRLNEIYGSVPLYQDQYVKAYNKNLGGMNVDLIGSTYYHLLHWK